MSEQITITVDKKKLQDVLLAADWAGDYWLDEETQEAVKEIKSHVPEDKT